MNKEFINIDISAINVSSTVRTDLGDLAALETSIRKLGLLSPVIIDKNNNLIAGARRLEACKKAGISPIPAFKADITLDSMEALDIQSDENLCRLKLSADDLEKHINSKVKSVKQPGPSGKFVSWLKKLFS